jgi:hypothetical protein
MKKINIILVMLVLIGVVGITYIEVYTKPQIRRQEQKYTDEQKEPLTHDFKRVLKYKSKYMGDASNLSSLNANLPLSNISKTFQLYPEELTVDINYKESIGRIDELQLKQALIYNSTANFALIDNLKVLRFNFQGSSYTITRSEVEKWYGIELSQLQDPLTWQKHVQRKLTDISYVDSFIKELVKIKS